MLVGFTTTFVIKISIMARCTTLCDKACRGFSRGPSVSSTNKTDHHDITEILLKVALHTITPTKPNLILCRLILCSIVFIYVLIVYCIG